MAAINNSTTIRRAKFFDAVARWIITSGGILVIASVIAILVLIVSVTLPLFLGATSEKRVDTEIPEVLAKADVLCVGVDRVELEGSGEGDADAISGYLLANDGTFTFVEFPSADASANHTRSSFSPGNAMPGTTTTTTASLTGRGTSGAGASVTVLGTQRAEPPGGKQGVKVVRVERSAGNQYTLLWSDGSASLVKAGLFPQYDEHGRRTVGHRLETLQSFPAEDGEKPTAAAIRATSDELVTCVRLLSNNQLAIIRQAPSGGGGLFGGSSGTQTHRTVIREGIPSKITAMTLNTDGTWLYAGTDDGSLVRWQLDDEGKPKYHEVVPAFRDQREITALAIVYGEMALVVGDAKGGVSVWFEVRQEDSRKFRLIHELKPHGSAIVDLFPSRRDKSVLSLDEDGIAHLDYTTSQRHLLTLAESAPLKLMGFAPRGNAMIGVDRDNRLLVWNFGWMMSENSHPEVSWAALFGKIHYENHEKPKFIWQSSGTDEPKFSLVPVIFGTFKATCYAMLFAVPLALFSAMYVSHFTTPAFKRAIKPVVEVMAAIPTVVIGFLILLWAAPLVGDWIVGVFASFLTIPVTFVLFMMLWQVLRKFDWAKRIENGYEFIVLSMCVILPATILAVALAGPMENLLFDGNFRQWLVDHWNIEYEQLNSIVVAFGLGFAVIPIIFSISEDALSDIPHSLTAASLALGASRWQTVWRVILPSASPGIFAAIMIGFGRAVGETMIVFMAAGNTPILDPSPFNGFRTLSANIAVEIGEAPRDGTLYRVLFLCAVLLFVLTFFLNTAAEIVRHHLRKKYGKY